MPQAISKTFNVSRYQVQPRLIDHLISNRELVSIRLNSAQKSPKAVIKGSE